MKEHSGSVAFSDKMFIPSYMEIHQLVQNNYGWQTHRHLDTRTRDKVQSDFLLKIRKIDRKCAPLTSRWRWCRFAGSIGKHSFHLIVFILWNVADPISLIQNYVRHTAYKDFIFHLVSLIVLSLSLSAGSTFNQPARIVSFVTNNETDCGPLLEGNANIINLEN
jgi:hypothetical protein